MFSVSTQTRYALRSLMFLAEQEKDHPVSVQLIAENEEISKKYLENIFKLLRRSGIVRSVRGPVGGYLLVPPAEDLTLLQIVLAVDGKISTADCVQTPGSCARSDSCGSRDVWEELQHEIESFLCSKTLDAIIKQQEERKVS